MSNDGDVIITRGKNKSNYIFWVFLIIIGFVAIYYPLFGSDLRFTADRYFSSIFRAVGIVCYTIGVLMLVWGILTLFCTRSFKAIGIMLVGFFLIIVASFWFEPATFGIFTHGKEVPKMYH